MKAVIESAGGVASRVALGTHELVFDQPKEVPGGQDLGPSPLDVMAVAVGACAHYYAAAFLTARKASVLGLRVEIVAEKTREPVNRLGRVAVHVILPCDAPEQYVSAIERAVRACPAYGTLLHAPEVELSFSRGTDAKAPAA